MKLISMSLYGHKPMYIKGAVANALLLPKIYPGWKMRVYCSERADPSRLEDLGCEIKVMPRSRRHSGMFWRFLDAWDTSAERVIFRDADSRFNVRGAAAVQAWEESGKVAHCMHDHLHHTRLPIMGGMWGIKPGCLPRHLFHITLKMSRRSQRRVVDMRFLESNVLPCIQDSLLRHSSVPLKKKEWISVPFPEHPPFEGFVGQQYDGEGNTIWPVVKACEAGEPSRVSSRLSKRPQPHFQ